MKRALDAVLLDLGGTLADLGAANGLPSGRADYRGREALLQAIRARGGRAVRLEALDRLVFEPWRAQYERRYELGHEAAWAPHLKALRRVTGVRMRDLTLLRAWFLPFADAVVPLPGAVDAVQSLARQGLRLGLVSNVPLPGALYLGALRASRLLAKFQAFSWSYDEGRRKPSPVLVRRALERLGVDPQRAILVGDRPASDIAAGRSAGLRATVWIAGAGASPPPAGLRPDETIATIHELPALVASHFS